MTHVTVRDTYYYLDGPQQGRPPDGKFPEDTRVEMLDEKPAYSRVESEDGITAWVETADLVPIGKT
jgi:hypothetical protein